MLRFLRLQLAKFFIMEISFRKSKNITIYLAGFLLVVAGLFLVFMPPNTSHPILGSQLFLGVVAGLFFVGAWRLVVTAWRRTKNNKPGMRVNEEGLQDFTSKINEGFLSWSEVEKLAIKEVVSSKFIVVYLHKPEQYLTQQKAGWRKNQLEDRYANYGSPYCISTNSLQTNTKALFELLEDYKSKYDLKTIA